MERARERLHGVDGRIAQPRQALEQQVELELGALRRRLRSALAQQPRQHRGRDAGQHVSCAHRAALEADLGADAVGLDRRHLAPEPQLGACRPRDPRQRLGQRAHAADRHVPVARAVADHVIEEAAVLAQQGVVEAGERPDQRVGGDDPTLEVVLEGAREQLAQRPLDQRLPGGIVADTRTQVVARHQRLGERGKDRFGHARGHGLEVRPVGVRGRAGADQQPAAVRARRVARHRAPAQLGRQPELVADRARQQRDQVRVARQARFDARPRPRGDGRAADVVVALEHEHGAARAREVGRGDEPVVAAADDDRVIQGVSPSVLASSDLGDVTAKSPRPPRSASRTAPRTAARSPPPPAGR